MTVQEAEKRAIEQAEQLEGAVVYCGVLVDKLSRQGLMAVTRIAMAEIDRREKVDAARLMTPVGCR